MCKIVRKVSRACIFFLMLAILISPLGGCGQKQPELENDSITLWVITESSIADGMNMQTKLIAQQMEDTHTNLTIDLEILPTDTVEREIKLKQLHTQIMAGKGPDVYLLPTGDVLTDYPITGATTRVEPLITDISQAMINGLFADIHDYYDADQALGTEALKKEIMDAGMLGEHRYVLPLRFNLPLVLTDSAEWLDFTESEEVLKTGVIALTDRLLSQENAVPAAYGLSLPTDFSLLPRTFDYEKGELLLTAEEIADYMRAYQAWYTASVPSAQIITDHWENVMVQTLGAEMLRLAKFSVSFDFFKDAQKYLWFHATWYNAGLPLYTDTLDYIVDALAAAKVDQHDIAVCPLRATDGSVIANIAYFGAVGGNSKNPELAYEFLRQFLTEEYQWDAYRPETNSRKPSANRFGDLPHTATLGPAEKSWPVRTTDSLAALWDYRKSQLDSEGDHGGDNTMTHNTIRKGWQSSDFILTDTDLPALSWPIDEVRFPIVLDPEESFEHALSLLNDENGNPTDVDIDALAEQVRLSLWWHLAEG